MILDKETVVRYIKIFLKNHSRGISHSSGTNWGTGEGQGDSLIETKREGQDDITTAKGSTRLSNTVQGSFEQDGENETWGENETESPVFEKRHSAVYSLPEQIEKAMALMVNQPTQHAIIKLPKKHTEMVKTPPVKSGNARPARVERFKNQTYRLTDFAKDKALIERQITERWQLIEEKAKEPIDLPEEPKKWRE
jgi:hypothetical protein